MGKRNCITVILLAIFAICCSPDKQSSEDLPCIDVTREYPEKEINLTDIADVTYLHLSTKDVDFLYKGSIDYVTPNTIVVVDRTSNSVLFFGKDGNPKSRFNRRGEGPEEYADAAYVMYDEAADDVYVAPDFSDYINVYSSSGEYKRKLTLPQRNIGGQMAFFDDQSILVYDNTSLWKNIVKKYSKDETIFTEQVSDSSFFLISKMDGVVSAYIQLPGNNIDLSFRDPTGGFGQVGYARVRKCPDGLFLYNPEADTIFLYSKDKTLTPFMHKKPLLKDLKPMIAMDICMDAGGFQYMATYSYSVEGRSPAANYYMRDKKTGEIFRQQITLPDYNGKAFYFNPRLPNYYEKGYHFELEYFELKEAYRENKLSGKLKELVATLDDDEDSNVFALVDFK